MAEWKKDPGNYRAMSVPFESQEKANEALGKFCDELAELRKKHKMPDVYTIIHASYIGEDGQEKQFLLPAQMGDALRAEGMTAWAYGYEQAERKARIDDAFSQALKKSGKAYSEK